MEILLVIAALVVGFWFLSKRGKEREEIADLRFFHYRDDTPDDITSAWMFDLRAMAAVYDFHAIDVGSKAERSVFHLRRRDSGAWEVKLTDESWKEAVARLRKRLANDFVRELAQERLDALGDKPTWGPVGDDCAGPLESQYQRFVRQYRES